MKKTVLFSIAFVIETILLAQPQGSSSGTAPQAAPFLPTFEVIGEGRPLLLISDLKSDEVQDELITSLKEHFKVILPADDLPDSLSLEQKASALMFISTRTSRNPLSIIGIGEGAAIALEAASLYPQDVDRVVILGDKGEEKTLHCPVLELGSKNPKASKLWKSSKDFLLSPLEDLLPKVKGESKKILFDLSHAQCLDIYEGHETYPKVVPAYKRMISEMGGAELIVNEDAVIDGKLLSGVDVLIMLSPLSNKLQKNLSQTERKALVDFVKDGNSLIFFIDDAHRVDWNAYGALDVVSPFGFSFGQDVRLPGNVGAVAFPNEIFSGRHEIPYSGACVMTGGEPVSVCMEEGYLHGSIVKLPQGGKLYVGGDTMVGLLLGYFDGQRKTMEMMETRWWGKDSYQYMSELIRWALVQ